MNLYIGAKVIRAGKIVDVERQEGNGAILTFDTGERIEVGPKYAEKHRPRLGDYFVQYPDGYASCSPGKTFEAAYRVLTDLERTLVGAL